MKKLTAIALLTLMLWAVTAPAAVHAQPADTDIYTVQPGDSLWIISLKYQVGLSEIIAANPQIKDPHWIYPGDKVTVPLLTGVKAIEAQVVKLVNEQREAHGLKPLRLNWELSRVARHKSEDMRDRNYFSHNSPTYGSPFDMIKAFGIGYSAAAENIAAGQKTAQAVMNSWMNSPGHRTNILSASYTEIGVGYASGGSYGHYWTQMFIKPR